MVKVFMNISVVEFNDHFYITHSLFMLLRKDISKTRSFLFASRRIFRGMVCLVNQIVKNAHLIKTKLFSKNSYELFSLYHPLICLEFDSIPAILCEGPNTFLYGNNKNHNNYRETSRQED